MRLSICSYFTNSWCMYLSLCIYPQAAFSGLMLGLLIGMTRLATDLSFPEPHCGEIDTRPNVIAHWHYLYFGILSFCIIMTFVITVSLLTTPLPPKNVSIFFNGSVLRQFHFTLPWWGMLRSRSFALSKCKRYPVIVNLISIFLSVFSPLAKMC